MLEVRSSGPAYQVGHEHGSAVKQQVAGSLAFYAALFQRQCSMRWDQVLAEAAKFLPTLEQLCPRYVEEMRGLAHGAGVDLLDIIALNVRTEIAFGLWTADSSAGPETDGCTSVACRSSSGGMLLVQNWDWLVEQADNLIIYHVSQPGIPDIAMVTEAGIIGKIGLNSHGVGVCLNAIRARGVDMAKLPTHLALRMALEATSAREAAETLQRIGTAGSSHILVADKNEAFGLECTSQGVKILTSTDNAGDTIVHTNHLILNHPSVTEPPWLPDSQVRLRRMEQLVAERQSRAPPHDINVRTLYEMFQDDEDFPSGINRCQTGVSTTQTLFNIIVDLGKKEATVTIGRPGASARRVLLVPGN